MTRRSGTSRAGGVRSSRFTFPRCAPHFRRAGVALLPQVIRRLLRASQIGAAGSSVAAVHLHRSAALDPAFGLPEGEPITGAVERFKTLQLAAQDRLERVLVSLGNGQGCERPADRGALIDNLTDGIAQVFPVAGSKRIRRAARFKNHLVPGNRGIKGIKGVVLELFFARDARKSNTAAFRAAMTTRQKGMVKSGPAPDLKPAL